MSPCGANIQRGCLLSRVLHWYACAALEKAVSGDKEVPYPFLDVLI
jgi:hypothetical protein